MIYSGLDYLEAKHQQWIDSNPSADFDYEALFRELCLEHPLSPCQWALLVVTLVDSIKNSDASLIANSDN